MASGPIQFRASTNPIDGLNARLKALGRKEVITSIKSSPTIGGCIDHDIHYLTSGGANWIYGYRQRPEDSMDHFAEKFFTHIGAAEQVAKEREDRKRDNPLTFKFNSAVRADMEYQQYLDDHKAMTVGSLFGENRFPRARERAFLDFRTQAASQTRYESFDYSDPHGGVVKKVLDAYLTHHLPDLSSIKCDLFATVEHGHAVVQMSTPMPDWRKCRTIRIPLSQDMPWYTAVQQARDTLREWIASAKESVVTEQNNPSTADYTVWIWGVEYPNARVEYREGIEQTRSERGFTHGIYKAGAKVSGTPRTVDKNGPFDITLKYAKGDIVILRNCSWIANGEIRCDGFEMNGKSSYQSLVGSIAQHQKAVEWGDGSKWGEPIPASKFEEVGRGVAQGFKQGVTAQQKYGDGKISLQYPYQHVHVSLGQEIPAGAMVTSDGKIAGEPRNGGIAYLNGVPVDVLNNVEYGDAAVMNLSTKPAGVTNDAQRVEQEAIDRGYAATVQAISVPTRDEIKCSLLERVANDGSRKASEVMVDLVAESTHETYKAIAQVAEGLRLQEEASKTRFDNLASQPLAQENLKKAFAELTKPMAQLPNHLDFVPQIGDDASVKVAQDKFPLVSKTCAEVYNESALERTKVLATKLKETASMPTLGVNEPFSQRAKTEAIEVAYRTAAIKLPDLVKRQLVKRMASKGGKRPSQARLSLAEEMLSGDEGSLIVAGILSLALGASPEFIKSKMPWLDIDRLARELRLNVETRIACAVADMLGMYLDGALEALKEAFGGSQQLLLAESSKPDESALFNGVPKAETVGVR